jgi:3-oxoacyl-[acyl-carrier-protein] synthase-3
MAVRSVILGTGSGVPDNVVTNFDLEKIMDTTDEWIVKRTGIKERRLSLPGEKWSDFMVPACNKALEAAGVKATEIDMIIAGTMTADMKMPTGGCTIQSLIGAKKAAAFTVEVACSGFVFAMTIADRFIRLEPHLKILALGGDQLNNHINYDDRSTAVLFGDGGGAAVMTGLVDDPDDRGILASRMYSDGDYGNLLFFPGGGSQDPAMDSGDKKRFAVNMRGSELFKVAVKGMGQACADVLEEAGIKPEEIDLVVPHQANLRIISAVAARLGLDMDKFYINIDRFGNTSAGTIPIALDECVRGGKIKKGDIVLMPVFGGGLTWGATLVRW